MSGYPAWTPASRPGLVPLHPLGFGTILGRSFAALRQNPKVLLGFALIVQTVAYLVVAVAIAAVAIAAFARLDTVPSGSEDYEAILAGSIAITALTGIVLGLAAGAFVVLVQGIVVTEVSRAVVAEKLRLRELWQRVRPVAWRLIGYTLLLLLALLLVIALAVLAIVALALLAPPAAIILTILTVLAAIPVALWLQTKLVAVPAVIVLERASVFGAIGRSWRLLRGRFWPALGVIVLIALVMGVLAQVVSLPFGLFSSGLTFVFAPTGDPDVGGLIGLIVVGLLTQVVTLLVQAMTLVVQATAATLIYVDCRMRHEGLDIDLQGYVERRDAGATDLTDPYTLHPGRPHPQRPAGMPAGYSGAYAPPAGYPVPGGYSAPGASPQGVPPQSTSGPAGPGPANVPAPGGHPAPAASPYPPGTPPRPPQPDVPATDDPASDEAPAPASKPATEWAAPGSAAEPNRDAPR